MRNLAMSEMAIARVHPAFGDVRFGELPHQLEGGLRPPGVQDDGWTLVFPFSHAPALAPYGRSPVALECWCVRRRPAFCLLTFEHNEKAE